MQQHRAYAHLIRLHREEDANVPPEMRAASQIPIAGLQRLGYRRRVKAKAEAVPQEHLEQRRQEDLNLITWRNCAKVREGYEAKGGGEHEAADAKLLG